MAKKKKEITDPNEIQVKLKKVAGFSPRIYVPALYIMAIILIVYIVLFHPGVARGGTLYTIEGLPTSVTVFVDGLRQEASPAPFYVLKGNRTFEIHKPGFKSKTIDIDVKGRIFASRFFPRKETLSVNLELEDSELILDSAYTEWAHWIQTGEPQLFYPVPPVLTPAAQDLYRGSQSVKSEDILNILSASFQHSNHPVFVKDILKALFLSEAKGSVLSIDNLSTGLADISDFLVQNPHAFYLVAGSASMAESPEELQSLLMSRVESVSEKQLTPLSTKTSSRVIGNSVFVEIPEGSYVMGSKESDEFPHIVSCDLFFIQQTEVSQAQFQEFVSDTGYSLDDFIFNESNSKLPMTHISFNDALAFTHWFSKNYCERRGFKAVIPTEIQWERAAKLNFDYTLDQKLDRKLQAVDTGKPGLIGLQFMDGNLWEWTRDDFRSLRHFFTFKEDSLESGIKTVKGGCYVNAPEGISPSTRGSQPMDFKTPFLGFRMVLERIE